MGDDDDFDEPEEELEIEEPEGDDDNLEEDVEDEPEGDVSDESDGDLDLGDGEDGKDDDPEDPDEVTITIGDADPEEDKLEKAPSWVKELRKTNRDIARENKELKAKLATQTETKPVVVGAKPTLEDSDFDTDDFTTKLEAWHDRKATAAKQTADNQAKQQVATDAWNEQVKGYNEKKVTLKVKDFDNAEAVVIDTLDDTQQSIIIQGAENAAHVVYALGKNPAVAKKLSAIKDPVKFSFAVAKLEKDLKVSGRKPKAAPERQVASGGSGDKSAARLDKLRSEANKTGDFTKLSAYKRKQRQNQK